MVLKVGSLPSGGRYLAATIVLLYFQGVATFRILPVPMILVIFD